MLIAPARIDAELAGTERRGGEAGWRGRRRRRAFRRGVVAGIGQAIAGRVRVQQLGRRDLAVAELEQLEVQDRVRAVAALDGVHHQEAILDGRDLVVRAVAEEEDAIGPGAAIDIVVAFAGAHQIVAAQREDGVIAHEALDVVAQVAAIDQVVMPRACDAGDVLQRVAPAEAVIVHGVGEEPGDDPEGGCPVGRDVEPAGPVDEVVAGSTDDGVVGPCPDQRVRVVGAGDEHAGAPWCCPMGVLPNGVLP